MRPSQPSGASRRGRRRLLAVALAALLTGALPASSAARCAELMAHDALAGGKAQRLAAEPGGGLIAIEDAATRPDGSGVVVWRALRPGGAPLRAVTRAVGRRWSAPRTISAPDAEVSSARLALGRNGGAALLWLQTTAAKGTVRLATWSAGRGWSAPQRLARLATAPLAVALGRGGTVTAAWVAGGRIRVAVRRGGAWHRSRGPEVGLDGRVAIDVDPDGRLAAAWLVWPGPRVLASTGSANGAWRRPQPLAAMPAGVSVAFGPRVGVAADGTAVAAWMTQRRDGRQSTVYTAAGSRTHWRPPELRSAPSSGGSSLALDVARDGSALLAWISGRGQRVTTARRAAGAWLEPQPVSDPLAGRAIALDATVSPAAVLWTTADSLRVSTATAAAPWLAPVVLRGPGDPTRRYTEAPRLSRTLALWSAGHACAQRRPRLGIGDNHAPLFSDPYWQALGLEDVRLVVGWDALRSPWQRRELDAWMAAARASHATPLVAFAAARDSFHRRVPSPPVYRRMFLRFRARYPWVRDYSVWNEANHCGQLCHRPQLGARFFDILSDACPRCRIVAADVMDDPGMVPWVRAFLKAARHRPRIWGLHNYGDANRFRTWGTRMLLRMVKGQIWFTETGGLVYRSNSVKGKFGPSIRRAAEATEWALDRLSMLSPRIKRIYLYEFENPGRGTFWDSAMLAPSGQPRPAYDVVRAWLDAAG